MLSAIRLTVFRYLVNRMLRRNPIKRKTIPISDARRIAVLFVGSQDPSAQAVLAFVSKLRDSGKQVDILAYADSKKTELPEGIKILAKKQVNLFGIPSGPDINYFQTAPFDIMICAWIGNCLPLRYIALTNKAHWRFGEFTPEKEASAEFMLNLPEDRQNLEEFFYEADRYLNSIRSHEKQEQTV